MSAAHAALPPDALGLVLGQFDGHGWNMAFDHQRQVLNGIYDFADAGIGPAHQDFIYAGLTGFDLMERVVTIYEAVRCVTLDRARIATLAGMHRLWELAEAGGGSDHVGRFADWCAWQGR